MPTTKVFGLLLCWRSCAGTGAGASMRGPGPHCRALMSDVNSGLGMGRFLGFEKATHIVYGDGQALDSDAAARQTQVWFPALVHGCVFVPLCLQSF